MSIADHTGILLSSALDQPRAGKANPNKPEFYAVVAYAPDATDELAALMTEASPNKSLAGLKLSAEANRKKTKPYAGIPEDWLIVKFAANPGYPPELFLETGETVAALPLNGGKIRTEFYAGQRVRMNGHPFAWSHESGNRGISWNLAGIMSAGGGDRRPGGNSGEPSESAFAKYRSSAQPAAAQEAPAQHQAAATGAANPFQVGSAGKSAASPFG
jgi:hypothetical protein